MLDFLFIAAFVFTLIGVALRFADKRAAERREIVESSPSDDEELPASEGEYIPQDSVALSQEGDSPVLAEAAQMPGAVVETPTGEMRTVSTGNDLWSCSEFAAGGALFTRVQRITGNGMSLGKANIVKGSIDATADGLLGIETAAGVTERRRDVLMGWPPADAIGSC